MWNYGSKKGGDKKMNDVDWDEEMTEDIDLDRDFKDVEEYVDEYDDGA